MFASRREDRGEGIVLRDMADSISGVDPFAVMTIVTFLSILSLDCDTTMSPVYSIHILNGHTLLDFSWITYREQRERK
jgi:hypothetical protein